MSKTKLLSLLVVALIIINIGAITALILGNSKHKPQKGRNMDLIIKRLSFDESQVMQYKQLIDQHRKIIKEKQKTVKSSKNELYQLLQTNDRTQKDLLLQDLSKALLEIEQINFDHFDQIKAICKPEQLDDFNKLSKDLAKMFTKDRPKKK